MQLVQPLPLSVIRELRPTPADREFFGGHLASLYVVLLLIGVKG